MPYIQVNDIQIYYEIYPEDQAASSSKTPLLLIQGLGASVVTWTRSSVERLSAHRPVILFDNRGAGKSDQPDMPYSMELLAADTVGLLDALEIERAHIFGVSLGGMVAQHVALDYPERVVSLILGCTAAGGPGHPELVSPEMETLAVLARPTQEDYAQYVREGWSIIYTPATIESSRDLLESRIELALNYPQMPENIRHRQTEAVFQTHDTYERLPEITCPTLVQMGQKDVLIPAENSRIIAKCIPNARLIEYPNSAHGYILEEEEQAVNDILRFLAEVDVG